VRRSYRMSPTHGMVNPLKDENFLNTVLKFSSYLIGNLLRLRYKDQPLDVG
jgi:hypothetical protein